MFFKIRYLFLCWTLLALQSVAAHATLPLQGSWNGFLNQTNIVECHNLSIRQADSLLLTLFRNDGSELGSIPFQLNARGTAHLILNSFPITNGYGTFTVDSNSSSTEKNLQINCHTAVYRLGDQASLGKAVEYAFALESSGDLHGSASGIFNSINPDGERKPVLNWLSLANNSAEPFSAQILLYNQDGSINHPASFRVTQLQPKERRDFALGHPLGQIVGLYSIVPDNAVQPYRAFNTRYGLKENGYRFAFTLSASEGVAQPHPLVASTMDPATNWLEVANVSEAMVTVMVQIKDQAGALRFERELQVEPFGQKHINVNSYLGERNLGSATARVLGAGRILFQSLYYGRLPNRPQTEWAYASQASGSAATINSKVVNSINTHLGAANWNIFINNNSDNGALDLKYFATDGVLSAERTTSLPFSGSTAYGVHQDVGADFIGQGIATSFESGASFSSELLRVFPHQSGGLGYIMRLPSVVVPPSSSAEAYFRFTADGDFIIKLTDPARIAEAREILRDPTKPNRHVMGRVVPSRVNYNANWSYHIDPSSIVFFELSTEVCDASLSYLQQNLDQLGTSFLPGSIFCPWSSRLVEEIIY